MKQITIAGHTGCSDIYVGGTSTICLAIFRDGGPSLSRTIMWLNFMGETFRKQTSSGSARGKKLKPLKRWLEFTNN
ncbi:MAG: hypothetical protein R2875_08020 [Desulfobacterales bacterium]